MKIYVAAFGVRIGHLPILRQKRSRRVMEKSLLAIRNTMMWLFEGEVDILYARSTWKSREHLYSWDVILNMKSMEQSLAATNHVVRPFIQFAQVARCRVIQAPRE